MTSSEELLLAYQRGDDTEALTALVSRIHKSAYRRALHLLGDPAAADDAVQEALISLVRGAKRFREGASFSPWWSAILRNAIRNEDRKLKAKARRDLKVGRERWRDLQATSAEERERFGTLGDAVAELPLPLREAIVLRYFENRSRREVASALGVSERATSKRLRSGLDRLRTRMKASGAAAPALKLEALLEQLAATPIAVPAAPAAGTLEAAALKATVFGVLSKAGALFLLLSVAGLALNVLVTQAKARAPRVVEAVAAPPRPGPAAGAEADGDEEPQGKPKPVQAKAPEGGAKPRPQPELSPEEKKKRWLAKKMAAARKTLEGLYLKDGPGSIAVTVRVEDAAGKPVAGAAVRVEQRRDASSATAMNSRISNLYRFPHLTDKEGRARFRIDHEVKRAEVGFFASRGALGGSAPIPAASEGGSEAVIRLRSLLKPAAGRGTLVLRVSGAPAKDDYEDYGVRLTRRGDERASRSGAFYYREIDAEGRFMIGGLAPGAYDLTMQVTRTYEARERFEIRAGEVTRVEVSPENQTRLEGEVRVRAGERGQPRVSVSGRTAEVSEGRYRIDGLEPGVYSVEARYGGYPVQAHKVEVKRGRNSGPVIDFTGPGHRLTGLVTERGVPASGAWLHLYPQAGGLEINSIFTGPDGRFSFGALSSGRYKLTARWGEKDRFRAERALLIEGDLELSELALQPGPQLEVEVVDAQGEPVAGARIAARVGQRGFGPSNFKTGDDGRAELRGLPAGQARLVAGAGGFYSKTGEVKIGEGAARLRLILDQPAAAVRLAIKGGDKGGLPIVLESQRGNVWRELPIDSKSGADGRVAFENLAPGRYWLLIDGSIERDLILGPGPRDLNIDLADYRAGLAILSAGKRAGFRGRFRLRGLDQGASLDLRNRLKGSETYLRRLPPGKYALELTVAEGAAWSFHQRALVTLREGAPLRFEAGWARGEAAKVQGASPAGSGFLVFRGPIEVATRPGPDGRFTVELPPGRYQVFASKTEWRTWNVLPKLPETPAKAPSIEVVAGQQLELGSIPQVR